MFLRPKPLTNRQSESHDSQVTSIQHITHHQKDHVSCDSHIMTFDLALITHHQKDPESGDVSPHTFSSALYKADLISHQRGTIHFLLGQMYWMQLLSKQYIQLYNNYQQRTILHFVKLSQEGETNVFNWAFRISYLEVTNRLLQQIQWYGLIELIFPQKFNEVIDRCFMGTDLG